MADKYCMNCGAKLPPLSKFCSSCGTPVGQTKTQNSFSRRTIHRKPLGDGEETFAEDETDVYDLPDIDSLEISIDQNVNDLGIGGSSFTIGGSPDNPQFFNKPFQAKRIDR